MSTTEEIRELTCRNAQAAIARLLPQTDDLQTRKDVAGALALRLFDLGILSPADPARGTFVRKEDLPSFVDILDRARDNISEAMSWLRSDWSDEEITTGQSRCRADAVVALGRAKVSIDRAKR